MTTQTQAEQIAQRQLDAYNAKDLDAFVACYSPNVEVYTLPSPTPSTQGLEALKQSYAKLFAQSPQLHAKLLSRKVFGRVVFDEEEVTGRAGAPDGKLHAMAIYHVDDQGLIEKVWFAIG